MIAYQISVSANNRPGSMGRVTKILAKEKINMRAVTISSTGDSGIINFLVDNPRLGLKVLKKEGLDASLKEVIAVLIDDRPGGLDSLIQLLAQKEINIENAYGFVLESWKQAVFVVDVDQIEKAEKIIDEAGFKTLDPDALSAIEPFHYMKY